MNEPMKKGHKPRRVVWLLGLPLVIGLLGLGLYAGWVYYLRLHVESLASAGRWRDALTECQTLLRWHPHDSVGSRCVVRALTRMNRAVEADQYRSDSASLTLEDLHLLGNSLLQAGEADRATKLYEEIVSGWPEDLTALKRLAALELGASHWDRAEALAKQLTKTPGGEVAGHTLAGSLYYHMGRRGVVAMVGMSVAEYERVLALDPDLRNMPLPRALFWSQFAYGLIKEGRGKEARRFLERAVGDLGEDAALLTQLGQIYLAEGEFDLAERTWRRAIELAPSASEAWLYLGREAMKRQDFQEATRNLERASTLAPESIEALHALAQAYRVQGKLVEAQRIQARLDRIRSNLPQQARP